MAFIPVDYGPQLHTDDEGYNALVAQRQRVTRGVEELGATIEGGTDKLVQGKLHTQALNATAAVKEQQAGTLEFIDSNPYVDKTALQQRMSPEDFSAWSDKLDPEYKDAGTVPMFTAAGALFDSEAKKVRADAGDTISMPGWRERWDATERTESSVIRERYVNRLAADQMIADHRAQTLTAVDKMVDAAIKPEDLAAAAEAAKTSPWLKPAERRFMVEKVLVAKDSFVAKQAMLGGDAEVMRSELVKLRSDNAGDLYPNMNVKQRLDLANQLNREYSFKSTKVSADDIVGPHVSETGKVDRTAIAVALQKYDGPNKEDVTRAVKVEEAAKLDIFDKKNAEVAQSIATAGQDPMTGRFSYARAMRDPAARRAAYQLNQDAPGLITNLSKEDARWENIDSKADAAERRAARQELIDASSDSLKQIHAMLDDPAQSDELKPMTPAQFDVSLYNRQMTEPDRQKARTAFAEFQKNGGKPDERASTIVASEVSAAGGGDFNKSKKIMAKYGDMLRAEAHDFIRTNSTLPPDKMSEALREDLRSKLLLGDVQDSGFINDTVRRIEWERGNKYPGKDFKLPDGTIIKARPRSSILLDEITLSPHTDVRVKTDADYDALPSGTSFIGPDGKTRRKP